MKLRACSIKPWEASKCTLYCDGEHQLRCPGNPRGATKPTRNPMRFCSEPLGIQTHMMRTWSPASAWTPHEACVLDAVEPYVDMMPSSKVS